MIKVKQWLRAFTVEPVNLSLRGKILSVASCFSVIFCMARITQEFTAAAASPILVASMGASAVIVFIIPSSPLAQPWPLIGGQLASAMVGVLCAQVFANMAFAAACAVGGSVLLMLLFRCLHPPGAATALTPIMAGAQINALGYDFVLIPVAINVAIMLAMALLINRWLLRYDYPIAAGPANKQNSKPSNIEQRAQSGRISEQDLQQALVNMDRFMDVTAGDLRKLLADAQVQSFKRQGGNISCGDIMDKNILTVAYGTDVEEAWKIMHREKLKAMPVLDRAKRVIGIITWNDFFKCIDVTAHETFQEKLRNFIRRTSDTSTNKPESVGHLMSSTVAVLQESCHIAELMPLMCDQSYRQIPIVNNENRLVGMVYQANLLAALYYGAHVASNKE